MNIKGLDMMDSEDIGENWTNLVDVVLDTARTFVNIVDGF